MHDDALDLLTFGETMGLIVPERPGRLGAGTRLEFSFGGAESNAAVAAARLGARVAWVSRLGDDGVGTAICRGLRAEGVEAIVEIDHARHTGIMLKERPTPSRQRVTYWRATSAASELRGDLVSDELLTRTAWLLVSGVTLALSPRMVGEVEDLIRRCRELGVKVAVDLNYRSRLWSRERAVVAYRRIAPLVDVLFAGVDEARLFSSSVQGLDDALDILSSMAVPMVVATDGANGAAARDARGDTVVPAHNVDVVDTVGAGDAFVGAFLAEWIATNSLPASLRTASAAGSHACLFPGDWEGSPTRDQLDHLLTEGVDR